MKGKDLQNEKLERAARKLLDLSLQSNREQIEKIVAAPNLFDSIKARIEDESQSGLKSKAFFGSWRVLPFFSPVKIGAAFAIIAFAIFSIIGFVVIDKTAPPNAQNIKAPELKNVFETPDLPPTPENSPEIATFNSTDKRQNNSAQTTFKTVALKTEKTHLRKSLPFKKLIKNGSIRKNLSEPNSEFFAVAVPGATPLENDADLRIVRAELSPKMLFALGVDLPLENASEKIKTDLLVGADGVARAIRFVR